MLRTLVFGTIVAIAGRQLYKSGALQSFGEDLKRRIDETGQRANARTGATASYPSSEPVASA